ncbi:putative receptor-type tyrosine-protein phosphatase T isoform X2 [Apostichopus japonicus]|uniref:protein-tyrosine-phosphatase n=1 Tax=Stichopus japonicus TaxID=307972 RepID=A0A2G8L7I0_STIJA|nr:putative receptor-type tyrosine-protein phosphatase T isoform X2 [Apostichopus japonicus]
MNSKFIKELIPNHRFSESKCPNEASLVDFWQMVWQENVATIVMLTSLIDGKKKVCLKYWPDQESIYGGLLVKCEKLEEHFQYDYRIFTIALKHGRESRTVKHFHFTDWGDMKIPEFLDPILDFLKIVRHKTSQKKVPNTIVHCSAGVGRTGTYITLDAMLDMAQAEGKVNVYKFVTEMRQRRRQSVQVKEQYQFIFDTLVKNFCIGRTTMTVKTFRMALASLKRTNDETGETYLTEQFKKLEEISVTTSASDMYAAKNMENKSQNQCSTFLPGKWYLHEIILDITQTYIGYSIPSGQIAYAFSCTLYVYRNLPRAAGLASSVWPDQVHWPGHSFPVTCTAKSK